MIYEKPTTSLHIFSAQPSGGIYPSYTITGINNRVANEPSPKGSLCQKLGRSQRHRTLTIHKEKLLLPF